MDDHWTPELPFVLSINSIGLLLNANNTKELTESTFNAPSSIIL